jgi:hypothetical protein
MQTLDFTTHVRPITSIIREFLGDKKLFPRMTFYPVQKWLYVDGHSTPWIDDIYCGSDLWEEQVCVVR